MISEIKFACSHCGQKIAVGSEAAGLNVECPTCQNAVTIPDDTELLEPERKVGGLRERLAVAQAEKRSFHNERLTLRSEAASMRQRAATAEARVASMQGDLDIARKRLEATETQLAATASALSESRAVLDEAANGRSDAVRELEGIRSELAAALDALERTQIAAAVAEARAIESARELAESTERSSVAEAEALSFKERHAGTLAEFETLRSLMDKDAASRELLSAKGRLEVALEELQTRRLSVAHLEATLLASEGERQRMDDERGLLHRRMADALRQAEESSKDRINADNEKLRELLNRQNEELKACFRELTRFRRARLTLKIVWALAVLGIVGLGYLFAHILPTIEWSR